MKILATTFLIIFSQLILFAQCPPGDLLLFSSQAQLDDFKISYPNCTELDADVVITWGNIVNLYGLGNLTSIEGNLSFLYNTTLSNMLGLENLVSIGGDLLVQFNETLVSLEGLQALTSIGGNLAIRSNYILGSLAGLDNIEAASIGDLSIISNFELTTCEVLSVCNYLSSPNGNVIITNNAEGCDSQQEVEDACVWVSLDEEAIPQSIPLYPNPCISTLNIELTGNPSHNTFLALTNTNGQEIISRQLKEPRTEINISSLPSGLYIARLWNDKNVLVKKVIKE